MYADPFSGQGARSGMASEIVPRSVAHWPLHIRELQFRPAHKVGAAGRPRSIGIFIAAA